MDLNNKPSVMKKCAQTLAVLIFWLALWALLAYLVDKQYVLPRPRVVAERALVLLCSAHFWLSTAASLLRILAGFALGSLSGIALAVLVTQCRPAALLLTPAIKTVRAAPVVSFIILALVWLDSAQLPLFISSLMVLPLIWANTVSGIENTAPELLEMARIFHVRRLTVWRQIYWPSVKPYLLAAATTALGLAWKSGITAEVIAAPRLAMGSEMQNAKVALEPADTFVWTIAVIALSLLLEALLKRLLQRGRV
ncbi:MAG: ABC transporter permease subunit [Bacillota bacterium]|nr:ABC transporter permease subunit [Bacillota bacterium]